MKQVILSGKLDSLYDMSNNVILAKLIEEDTEDIFYIFWDNNRFENINETLFKKRVVVSGKLEYIKVMLENNERVRRLLAVFVEYLEFYEVDNDI